MASCATQRPLKQKRTITMMTHVTVMAALLLVPGCVGVKTAEDKSKSTATGSTFDFSEVDLDGSGCVQGPEEKQKFRMYIGSILRDSLKLGNIEMALRAGRITHSADINGDGKICECDLLTIFLTDSIGNGRRRHAFRVFEDGSIFDSVDADGDGYLSDDREKGGLTRKLAECVSDIKARTIVDAMSKLEKDDGKLARTEYMLFLNSPHHFPPAPRPPLAYPRPLLPPVPIGRGGPGSVLPPRPILPPGPSIRPPGGAAGHKPSRPFVPPRLTLPLPGRQAAQKGPRRPVLPPGPSQRVPAPVPVPPRPILPSGLVQKGRPEPAQKVPRPVMLPAPVLPPRPVMLPKPVQIISGSPQKNAEPVLPPRPPTIGTGPVLLPPVRPGQKVAAPVLPQALLPQLPADFPTPQPSPSASQQETKVGGASNTDTNAADAVRQPAVSAKQSSPFSSSSSFPGPAVSQPAPPVPSPPPVVGADTDSHQPGLNTQTGSVKGRVPVRQSSSIKQPHPQTQSTPIRHSGAKVQQASPVTDPSGPPYQELRQKPSNRPSGPKIQLDLPEHPSSLSQQPPQGVVHHRPDSVNLDTLMELRRAKTSPRHKNRPGPGPGQSGRQNQAGRTGYGKQPSPATPNLQRLPEHPVEQALRSAEIRNEISRTRNQPVRPVATQSQPEEQLERLLLENQRFQNSHHKLHPVQQLNGKSADQSIQGHRIQNQGRSGSKIPSNLRVDQILDESPPRQRQANPKRKINDQRNERAKNPQNHYVELPALRPVEGKTEAQSQAGETNPGPRNAVNDHSQQLELQPAPHKPRDSWKGKDNSVAHTEA